MTVKDILFGVSKESAAVVGDPYWDSVALLTDSYGADTTGFYCPTRGLNIYSNKLAGATPTVSNGSLFTSVGKFGTSIFDPNTANVIALNISTTSNANPYFGINSSPFTVEFWVRRNTRITNSTNTFTPLINLNSATTAISYSSAGLVSAYGCNNVVNAAAGTLAVSTWYHVAYVRENSTTYKLYVNGVLVANSTQGSQTGTEATSLVLIGTSNVSKGTAGSNGDPTYIENLRITQAARYTAPFTPPTALFPMFKTGSPQYLTRAIFPTIKFDDSGTITGTVATWAGSPTLAYQWQSTQTTASLTWNYTDISGATASTFTGTLTANKCYRLKTTATIGGLVTVLYSNPIYVRVAPL